MMNEQQQEEKQSRASSFSHKALVQATAATGEKTDEEEGIGGTWVSTT